MLNNTLSVIVKTRCLNMSLVDFSNCKVVNTKLYGDSIGKKKGIIYNNEKYLLKFSSKNKDGSYSNSAICEYVACHIFDLLGFNTQQIILGKFKKNHEYLVVACKDFTEPNKTFCDFAS